MKYIWLFLHLVSAISCLIAGSLIGSEYVFLDTIMMVEGTYSEYLVIMFFRVIPIGLALAGGLSMYEIIVLLTKKKATIVLSVLK